MRRYTLASPFGIGAGGRAGNFVEHASEPFERSGMQTGKRPARAGGTVANPYTDFLTRTEYPPKPSAARVIQALSHAGLAKSYAVFQAIQTK